MAAVVGDRAAASRLAASRRPSSGARRTEAALAAGASIDEAQRTLIDEIAPIDDIRSTAEYRRRVAANLLALVLERRARAGRMSVCLHSRLFLE